MYGSGQGVKQDYVVAHMLYNLAAAKGGDKAEGNRDFVAKKMTSEQILSAQMLAKQCLSNNYKNCIPLTNTSMPKSNSKKFTM